MKTKEYSVPISPVDILNALFISSNIGSSITSSNLEEYNYLKVLQEMKDLLRSCIDQNKTVFLVFSLIEDTNSLHIECEILEVQEAFVKVRTIRSQKGTSIDLTSTVQNVFYICKDRFLKKIDIYDHAPTKIIAFDDKEIS